jgi:hypothetical protein
MPIMRPSRSMAMSVISSCPFDQSKRPTSWISSVSGSTR